MNNQKLKNLIKKPISLFAFSAIVSVASKLSCCLAMTPPALDSKPVALTAPRNLHQVFNSLHQMGIYKMAALSLP